MQDSANLTTSTSQPPTYTIKDDVTNTDLFNIIVTKEHSSSAVDGNIVYYYYDITNIVNINISDYIQKYYDPSIIITNTPVVSNVSNKYYVTFVNSSNSYFYVYNGEPMFYLEFYTPDKKFYLVLSKYDISLTFESYLNGATYKKIKQISTISTRSNIQQIVPLPPKQEVITTLQPQTSILQPQSSILQPQSSILQPQRSTVQPQSSILQPQLSTVQPQSSILQPQESIIKQMTDWWYKNMIS
jgi:hypothetical protein